MRSKVRAGLYLVAVLVLSLVVIVMFGTLITACGGEEGDWLEPDGEEAVVDAGPTLVDEIAAVPADCVSRCGSKLVGSNDCRGFQGVEDSVLRLVPKLYDTMNNPDAGMWAMDAERLCGTLKRWTFIVTLGLGGPDVTPPGWENTSGRAECGFRTVLLGSATWSVNAYAHEVVHIALGCNPGHDRWDEGGAFEVIAAVHDQQWAERLFGEKP